MHTSVKKAAFAVAATGTLVIGAAGMASATETGHGHHPHGGGAVAVGEAHHSPGVVSGNVIQAPINIPINFCGNTINIIGLLNPTFGNSCANL